MPVMTCRDRHLSEAIRWCALSVAWAMIVGVAALVAGFAAGVIALVGFGADSIVDGSASAVLVWRFRHERSTRRASDLVERRAARVVGAVLVVIGLYVSVSAVTALAGHSEPERSTAGVVLSAASILVLSVLARAKLRLAGLLSSPALRGDGVLSLAGAALATVTLASLVLTAAFGWWWSDAVAALAIALVLLREGGRVLASSQRELGGVGADR
jgi:divalent metal cation (Fe/Co/Zn/Cd) transporter